MRLRRGPNGTTVLTSLPRPPRWFHGAASRQEKEKVVYGREVWKGSVPLFLCHLTTDVKLGTVRPEAK